MKPSIFTVKLVRSFSIGFCINSPKLNGVSFEIYIGCIHLTFWSRGKVWLKFNNFWG